MYGSDARFIRLVCSAWAEDSISNWLVAGYLSLSIISESSTWRQIRPKAERNDRS
jgi:hypothetical protein